MTWYLNFVLYILIALILSGCVEREILDDINLVDGIGFDYTGGETIMGTTVFPSYLPDQPPKNRTHTSEASIQKSILQDITRRTSDPIVTGSLEIVLFGDELARKQGILDLVDALQRDPGIGSGLYLAVVDGKAKELLEGQYGIRGNSTHISKLIEHNIKLEDLPKTNLHLFLRDFFIEGETAFMPQIKQVGKQNVELNGICLFKSGKIVDTLSKDKMFFFKLLVDKYSRGLHRVKIEGNEAAVRDIKSTHHFKLTKRNPHEVVVQIKVSGVIEEFTGNDLTPKKVKLVQKQFEQDIKDECLAMIQRFQKKGYDPVGFGHFVKTKTRNFDMNHWKESQYKELVVKIEPSVKITEAGVIE